MRIKSGMATNIGLARKRSGMTQQDVADKLSMERSSYARYETGTREPDMATLEALVKVFDTNISYLTGHSESPDPTPPPVLSDVYFRFAKNAEQNGIHPDDIADAMDLIKKLRKPGGKVD